MELVLFQQSGLDACRACSQQMELLQRNDHQQRKTKKKKEKKDKKSIRLFSGWQLSATVYLPKEGQHLKEKDLDFLHMAYR